MLQILTAEKFTYSLTGTLDRPWVVAPSKICGHVRSSRHETSVILDLLHPRSAGSSRLALPLWPDVKFTACTSSGVVVPECAGTPFR